MVARLKPSGKLSGVMNYNEQKVARNEAELIHASGFLNDKDRMNFHEKMERFQRQNELHPGSKVNTLHISLNFDPSENLSQEKLAAIADRYMELMGLGKQPYLVYQHNDAGHPHIHIVTTLIREDGTRVNTQNIGKDLSEKARKAVEKEFKLVPADSKKRQQAYEVTPVDVQKVMYGNTREMKKSMTEVLKMVGKEYKFTSLEEYNAVLRQYNVTADKGGPDSRVNKNGGLVYRTLDDKGNKVGVPVKASDFHFRPILKELEKKFEKNKELRKADLPGIRRRVDWALNQHPNSLRDFVDELKKENIELVIRQNEQGRVYGLTFIDNTAKTVIKGSDLGKGYSAGPILDRFDQEKKKSKSQTQAPAPVQTPAPSQIPPPGKTSAPGQAPAPGQTPLPKAPGQTLPTGKGSGNPSGKQPWPEKGTDPEMSALRIPKVPDLNLKAPQLLSDLMKYDESFGHSPLELTEDLKKKRRTNF